MAEETEVMQKKGKGDRLPAGTRAFYKPRIALHRLGRETTVFSGEVAIVQIESGIMKFMYAAQVKVAGAVLKASRIRLSMASNRVHAKGNVSLEENGVSVSADSLTATPALTGMVMDGRVRMKSDSREAAESLLKSHKS